MFDLKLRKNEKVLLYTSYVKRMVGTITEEIENLYLSNQSLIFVYNEYNESTNNNITIRKLALRDIGVYNEVPQVFRTKIQEGKWALKVMLKNGTNELLIFKENNEILDWEVAITNAIKEIIPDSNDNSNRICPNCNAPLGIFQTICDYCGCEVPIKRSCKEVDKFIEGLNKIRSREIPDFKIESSKKNDDNRYIDYNKKVENHKEERKIMSKLVRKGLPRTYRMAAAITSAAIGAVMDKSYEHKAQKEVREEFEKKEKEEK